jgi:hypothetical protein
LAVGRDPAHQMTVSFASKWSDPGIDAPLGGVHIGLDQSSLDRFIPEQEFPLQYNETIPGKRMYYAPFQHHITMDDLEPNTTYYYVAVVGTREHGIDSLSTKPLRFHHQDEIDELESRLKNQDESEDSTRLRRRLEPPPYDGSAKPCYENDVRSFTTAPEGSESPVSFAIIGDMGQFPHSKESLDHMKVNQDEIDAVMLVGDIAYTGMDHRGWDTFFDFLDDYSIFDEVPVQIATGNHGTHLHLLSFKMHPTKFNYTLYIFLYPR